MAKIIYFCAFYFYENYTNMIPKEVIKAARGRTEIGGKVVEICKYNGEIVYGCKYDEEMTIGLPEFYLWNGRRAKIVKGVEALNLLSELPI